MNIEYLADRISDRGFELVYIFQGSVKELKQEMTEHPVFVIDKGMNHVEQLEKFAKFWPGQYTAFLRKNQNAPFASAERVQFSTNQVRQPGEVLQAVPVNGTGHFPVDIEEIKKQVRAEMKNELLVDQFQYEMQNMREEMMRMRQPEERLANVGMRLLEVFKIIPPGTTQNLAQPINGTATPQAENTGDDDGLELTDEQAEKLESDVAILVTHLGLDKIHHIATRIKNEPNIVALINQYI